MEATCSESQYDQIENHHKGGEGKTEGEADGEGKDKSNLEHCNYGTLENPSHRIRPLSGRNAHLSANMFLITLNSVFFRFPANWHKIDIKRLSNGRFF